MKYIKNILIYLLSILIILQCYSLLSVVIGNRYFYLAILLVLMLLIICEIKIKLNTKYLAIAALYCVGISLLFTSSYFHNVEFICSVLLPFPLFLIYFNEKNNLYQMLEAYTNVMVIISSLSLFFFIFGSLLGIIKPTRFYSYTEINWGNCNYYDYYHLYCQGQEVFALGYSGVRNIALFLEGPMLTYTLSFAIYYELFFRKDGYRKSALIIMISTIITSFSTTGLLVVLVLLYLKFYEHIKNNKMFKIFFVPTVVLIVAYLFYYILQDKFASNIYSSSARTDDIAASFKCYFFNFINGVGYQNIDAIYPYRGFKRANAGLSTGLGAILAYGGTVWGVWYVIPLIFGIKNYILSSKTRVYMGFVILSLALLLVTIVHSRILCTMVNAICWIYILQDVRLRIKN